jgi:hypothetical protein
MEVSKRLQCYYARCLGSTGDEALSASSNILLWLPK